MADIYSHSTEQLLTNAGQVGSLTSTPALYGTSNNIRHSNKYSLG